MPIVALLTFLGGAVVAFLGATVLERFGASIYTVALVALAFVDPARYVAGVGALAATPPAIWALCVLVLALHFLVPAVHRPART